MNDGTVKDGIVNSGAAVVSPGVSSGISAVVDAGIVVCAAVVFAAGFVAPRTEGEEAVVLWAAEMSELTSVAGAVEPVCVLTVVSLGSVTSAAEVLLLPIAAGWSLNAGDLPVK
ncbi:MAG: hypothetical protein WCG21_13290 [Eubacteriales bacterium]